MNPVKKEIEDFERFEEILKILVEEGSGALIRKLELSHHLSLLERFRMNKEKPGPERVRETFERLGPTFIKFGQILAQRPDIVPESYRQELEKLEDRAPEFDHRKAREVVDKEVGLHNFQSFEREPMAAASIAQVHEAELETGERVVVKIKRPGIREKIEKDLDILEFLAKRAEKHLGKMRRLRVQELVDQFSSWTLDELDLQKEARNAEIFRRNMEDEERVVVPEVYTELTTENVMVMEYMEGVKCTQEEKLKRMEIDREEVAETAIRVGLKQGIRDGFFHADPHPSNFLLRGNGEVVYLDFGMMGRLTKEMRENIGLLFLHAATEDVEAAMDTVQEMAYVEEDADLEGLREDIEQKILLMKNSTLGEHSLSRELLDITVKAADRGVHMPPSFAIIGKGLITMEGIGLTIYPDFEIREEYREILEDILIEENQPEDLLETFVADLIENKEIITRLPHKLNQMTEPRQKEVRIVEKGDSNKGIVAAGLVIGSSLLLAQHLSPDTTLIVGLIELLVAALLLQRL